MARTTVPRPPASGAGSGRANWTAYAESLDLQVDDGVKLADIIQACNEAEEELRSEPPVPFDENDPYAFMQHALGTEFVTYEGTREYQVNPVTGYAVKRIS